MPATLSLLFFLLLTGEILFASTLGWHWAARAGIAYLVWHYSWRHWENWKWSKRRRVVLGLSGGLKLIREEIASNAFYAKEIIYRLRRLEGRGLYLHSLVFALVEAPHLEDRGPVSDQDPRIAG